jgi:2-polyprenyl-3-methyl-5-hydroxy-6-metoxy-1,4-benzoquinol methylase
MSFPSRAALALREHALPIVGGLYFHRSQDRNHDPIAFRFIREETDDNGLLVAQWASVRDDVQAYFERVGVPYNAGGFLMQDPPEDHLLEIDGLGTGCMMIHRSVFEAAAMQKPYWQYRLGRGSEDLDFCFRARMAGFPVFVDMAVVCGHFKIRSVGHNEFMKYHRVRGVWQTDYKEEDAIEWVNDFMDIEDAEARMASYEPAQLAAIWQASGQDGSPEAVQDFYKLRETGETYLKDLLFWNASSLFRSFKGALVGLEAIDVIELGSGIGTISIQMALQDNQVTSVEINDFLRNFAEWRWKELIEEGKYSEKTGDIDFVDSLDKISGDRKYELAISIDVFEHLDKRDLYGAVRDLGRLLKIGGRLFAHNNWGQQDVYPMHFNNKDVFDTAIRDAGLFQIEEMWWVKVNHND